ncbi:MAG: prolyl oligopeptidase family serine peptidase [Siculibacillus sp.]|nr:prolyl oligopeptidase family serine peptidase [Siculibacillus sp.]
MSGAEPNREDFFRPQNWREAIADPSKLPDALRRHFEQENADAERALAPVADLAAEIFADLVQWDAARRTVDHATTTNWIWRRVTGGGADFPSFEQVPVAGGAAETVLDVGALATEFDCPSVHSAMPSPDERFLAHTVDERGNERFVVRVKDLETGRCRRIGDDVSTGAVVWSAGSTHLFHVARDSHGRAATLVAAPIDGSEPLVLLSAPDPTRRIEIRRSADASHLIAHLGDYGSAEVFIVDLAGAPFRPRPLLPARAEVLWDVEISGGEVFVRHDAVEPNGFTISRFALGAPFDPNATLVAPSPGAVLIAMAVRARHLLWVEVARMRQRLGILDRSRGTRSLFDLPSPYTTVTLHENGRHDTDRFALELSSLARPRRGFVLDAGRGELAPIDPEPNPPPPYVTETIDVVAPDGASIPVSLVWHPERLAAGPAPCLLAGYGAYGRAQWPDFDGTRRALLERGIVFAIAHVRGGSETGREWYRRGKGLHKEATFTDYLAVADHLIASGRTAPDRLVGFGRSAGGILMGVMVNRHSDRFCAILAEVPFVDVARTMSDTGLALTPPEWAEWGDPRTDAEARRVIEGYSPVDNPPEGEPTAVLCMCGLSDPRVTFWEPARWIAGLRERRRGDAPILLMSTPRGGHLGAVPRSERLREIATSHAFVIGRATGVI